MSESNLIDKGTFLSSVIAKNAKSSLRYMELGIGRFRLNSKSHKLRSIPIIIEFLDILEIRAFRL
jgi:hypothetical protein